MGLPGRLRAGLFVATVLVGSSLLFLVEPMVARMALPRLGGAPAVWNSAMLVYQVLMLGGYAYAHAVGRLSLRRQGVLHLALLGVAGLWLPLGLVAGTPSADASPVLWVPWLFSRSVGPLFFVIAAQAPLVQRWYAAVSGGRDPYVLYAASNLGSLGGLLAYPVLVEPHLDLAQQSTLWTTGYAVLALLVVGCAVVLRGQATRGADVRRPTSAAPTRRQIGYWVVCGLVPSGLMLATTSYLTTDIVAMPLVWVVPLGLYLASFTVAFASRRGPARAVVRVAPLVLVLGAGLVLLGPLTPLWGAACAVVVLAVTSTAIHTALYDARPAPDRLTGFYLAMSVGGALGGVVAGLVAPVVLPGPEEYPLLLLAAALLVPLGPLHRHFAGLWESASRRGETVRAALVVLVAATGLAVGLGVVGEPAVVPGFALVAFAAVLAVGARRSFAVVMTAMVLVAGGWGSVAAVGSGTAGERSYFGVYRTLDDPDTGVRVIVHGTTVHGLQLTDPARERTPTTYYAARSGIGETMRAVPVAYDDARVGVVGLGVGTLACYGVPGQRWTFYEIDPLVERIAEDTSRFTFLRDCLPADGRVVIGDARLSLATQARDDLDVLVLDAFSSDSVPMHLLTREAFETYDRVVADDGLLAVHISNRSLDLEPVVAAAARAGGWDARVLHYRPTDQEAAQDQAVASAWVLLSHRPDRLAEVVDGDPRWTTLESRPGFRAWTDQYSSILPIVTALH